MATVRGCPWAQDQELLLLVFNCAWDHYGPERVKALSKWIHGRGWFACLLQACADGHLPKVQWLFKQARKHYWVYLDDHDRAFHHACCMGHLHVAEWLLCERKRVWGRHVPVELTTPAITSACAQGRLDVVQWLMPLVPESVHFVHDWLYNACTRGHLHVVKWLCTARNLTVRHHTDAFVGACLRGHVAIARWFMDQADPDWAWPPTGIRHLQNRAWSGPRSAWMRAVILPAAGAAPAPTNHRTARAASRRKSGRG